MGAIGVLGILCLWFDGLFWAAAVIAGTLSCVISESSNFVLIFKEKNPSLCEEGKPAILCRKQIPICRHGTRYVCFLFALVLGIINTNFGQERSELGISRAHLLRFCSALLHNSPQRH